MKPRTRFDVGCAALMLLAAALFWALLVSIAEASGDCRDGSCNEVTQSIDSPVAVSGDDSLALGVSNSFGGVAVGDCVITTQTNIVVVGWQRYTENEWCMALFYDQNGLHEMAAKMRCQVENVRSLFEDRETCILSNLVKPVPRTNPEIAELRSTISEYAAVISVLRDDIETLRSEQQKQIEAVQQRPARPRTVIQQQPFLTDEKRAALAAIRGE